MAIEKPDLPQHIEDSVASVAELHDAQSRETSPARFGIVRITRNLGRPGFLVAVVLAICAWIVLNLVVLRAGVRPIDAPPFPWLQGTISALALFMTILILSTQQRDDEMGEHRDKLTLQLAIASEQKLTKLIGLLEEMRRDDPHLADRTDHQAAQMAVPTDPKAVSEAIKRTAK